jgi:hypothetical protein
VKDSTRKKGSIHVATVPVPSLSTVVHEIGQVFERAYAAVGPKPTREEVDDVLARTVECACVLEDERRRIELEVRSLVATADDQSGLLELRSLEARHAKVDRNSRWLRALADELRDYAKTLPDRPAPSTR